MWLLIAEMMLALAAIVFIMWWTMRARVERPLENQEDAPQNPSHIAVNEADKDASKPGER